MLIGHPQNDLYVDYARFGISRHLPIKTPALASLLVMAENVADIVSIQKAVLTFLE